MRRLTVRWSTEQFVFSHGRQPRGCGVWAFSFQGSMAFSPCLTFTQAKRWFVRELMMRGTVGNAVVVVCP